jgi:hypothetical protein
LHIRGRITSMATAPGGTALYVFSYTGHGTATSSTITRIDGATGIARQPIRLARGVDQALIAPGGTTAYGLGYWSSDRGAPWAVIAINLATGAEHKLLTVNPDFVPLGYNGAHALILHGHILYTTGDGRIAAVDVATGRALPLLRTSRSRLTAQTHTSRRAHGVSRIPRGSRRSAWPLARLERRSGLRHTAVRPGTIRSLSRRTAGPHMSTVARM